MTIQLVTPNQIATNVHTRRYDRLHLIALPTNVVPNNAGPYYYLVQTREYMAHTAFRNRASLDRWLIERGLSVDFAAIPQARDTALHVDIAGAYVDALHVTTREQFDQLVGYDCALLHNAEYTHAVITQHDNGEHVVNYLAPGHNRIVYDYHRTTEQRERMDLLTSLDVHRSMVAAFVPEINGWQLGEESMTGSWLWTKTGVDAQLYATPWFGESDAIPVQLVIAGDDEKVGTIESLLLHNSKISFYRGSFAREDAERYVAMIAPVLAWVEQRVADLRASIEMPSAGDVARGLATTIEEAETFDGIDSSDREYVVDEVVHGSLKGEHELLLVLSCRGKQQTYRISVECIDDA